MNPSAAETTMSYCHMFYGLDLHRLQSLYASGDEAFVAEVLAARAEELADNDGFFDEPSDEANFPSSEMALRQIVAGSIPNYEGAEAMYGYVLKILCEHLGESIGDDVAAVREHPYKSKLLTSGPPIPIPVDPGDFPEIGYLALEDIDGEIARLDAKPPRARWSLRRWLVRKLTGGMMGRQWTDADVAADMAAYRETLVEAKDKGLSIVSFRH
jgi:hypothetical protein